MAIFIDSVWTSADDQISSQYRLSVNFDVSNNYPSGLSDASNLSKGVDTSWLFRLDKSFTIPSQTTTTYETYFNGIKIPRVGAKEDTDKKMKLDFRADQAGAIYQFFKNWIDKGFSPIDAYMDSEAKTRNGKNITIELLKRGTAKTAKFDTGIAKTFTFYHVQPFEVNLTELNHETGEPVRVEVQFIYLYYDVTTPKATA